tara:strand:+ start:343 stop:1380 length:1038 start_codon:yes stop_codon:yes gene_type:complete
MKSKISTIISLSLLLTVSLASEQRIASLGGNAGFWAEDDQNIYIFPSSMHSFNIAQIDGNGDNMKAAFLFGEGTKYGFFMNESSNQMINMAYGSGSWGLLLGYDINASGEEYEYTNSNLSLGFGINIGSGELGLHLMSMNSEHGIESDYSSMGVGLNLRSELAIWEFSHVLVSFNFNSGENGYTGGYYEDGYLYDADYYEEMSSLDLNVDFYRHWNLTESTDLLFALGFGYMSSTSKNYGTKTEISDIMFPKYTFAVETNLLDWGKIRAGLNESHLLSSSTKVGGNEYKTMGNSDFNLLFGIGADYGGFKLDLNLNPGFFVDPVSFITGFNDETIASQFSITYAW